MTEIHRYWRIVNPKLLEQKTEKHEIHMLTCGGGLLLFTIFLAVLYWLFCYCVRDNVSSWSTQLCPSYPACFFYCTLDQDVKSSWENRLGICVVGFLAAACPYCCIVYTVKALEELILHWITPVMLIHIDISVRAMFHVLFLCLWIKCSICSATWFF